VSWRHHKELEILEVEVVTTAIVDDSYNFIIFGPGLCLNGFVYNFTCFVHFWQITEGYNLQFSSGVIALLS